MAILEIFSKSEYVAITPEIILVTKFGDFEYMLSVKNCNYFLRHPNISYKYYDSYHPNSNIYFNNNVFGDIREIFSRCVLQVCAMYCEILHVSDSVQPWPPTGVCNVLWDTARVRQCSTLTSFRCVQCPVRYCMCPMVFSPDLVFEN